MKYILCVDDDKIILNSLKAQLKQYYADEFMIELAESAEEALEILEELHEKNITSLIVISDWLMPTMKGDEYLQEVHKKFPKVGQIMLSGQADKTAIEETFERTNLSYFIEKPWRQVDLVTKIDKVVLNLELD